VAKRSDGSRGNLAWTGGRPRPWPHCVRWGPSSPPQKGGTAAPPLFGPCLLWPNGWMDQDATWYGGVVVGFGPCHIVLDRHPASFRPQERGHSPPIFGLCLLWPNGWMDQDAAWYEGRPRSRPRCVRWGPNSPKGHSPPIFCPCLLWPNGSSSQLLLSLCFKVSY